MVTDRTLTQPSLQIHPFHRSPLYETTGSISCLSRNIAYLPACLPSIDPPGPTNTPTSSHTSPSPMADRFYPSDPADAEVENGIWIHPSDDDTGSYRYKVNDRGYSFDPSAVIIAVDGACRGNGNPWARAAYGIYFGPRNWWNECQTLDNSESGSRNWTSQRAEVSGYNIFYYWSPFILFYDLVREEPLLPSD